jgi:hypothetical protein
VAFHWEIIPEDWLTITIGPTLPKIIVIAIGATLKSYEYKVLFL